MQVVRRQRRVQLIEVADLVGAGAERDAGRRAGSDRGDRQGRIEGKRRVRGLRPLEGRGRGAAADAERSQKVALLEVMLRSEPVPVEIWNAPPEIVEAAPVPVPSVATPVVVLIDAVCAPVAMSMAVNRSLVVPAPM